MAGVITGGWEFVIGAYVLTAVVLLGYTWSIVARLRAETGRAAREAKGAAHE